MPKILITNASASDGRGSFSLLTRAEYDPVNVESIEAGKVEAAKLPPGAIIVTAKLRADVPTLEGIMSKKWGKEDELKQLKSDFTALDRQ